MKNLYRPLGLKPDASQDDIKRAYRKLARQWHPDTYPDPKAAERFKAVTEAYETLSDPAKRAEYDREYAATFVDGALVLDDVKAWFARFISVTNHGDLDLLTLWCVHTWVCVETFTSPRLLIDSTVPESGKTTCLDHLEKLCFRPVKVASLSSPALLPRMIERSVRTVLLDEIDRSLRPGRDGVEDLIAILNSGYRFGSTRPVLVPAPGGGWDAREMSTYSPVAMAGNYPHLPADTMSRQLRILMTPDLDGNAEDSDWEVIEPEAKVLKGRIEEFADSVRDEVRGLEVDLPKDCLGRRKEKWRPLARVAAVAGGDWPTVVHQLIEANLREEAAEREDGLKTLPPGMVLLKDLHDVWPKDYGGDPEHFAATRDLVPRLVKYNLDYWGKDSPYGKQLTETRFGRLISDAAKLTSSRPGGAGPRGYLWTELKPIWHRLGIGRKQPGEPGEPGEPGGNNRVHRVSQLNRVHQDPPPGSDDEAVQLVADLLGGHIIDEGSDYDN